jgi:hypothetical protein
VRLPAAAVNMLVGLMSGGPFQIIEGEIAGDAHVVVLFRVFFSNSPLGHSLGDGEVAVRDARDCMILTHELL